MNAQLMARLLGCALLQFAECAVAQADQYWSYSDRNIEVTAEGNAKYAATLAHNLAQLDAALVRMFIVPAGSWRMPLHVYALPGSVYKKVWGAGSTSVFTTSGFESAILLDNSDTNDHRYWPAYFGYTAAILTTQGTLRYPYWYTSGISSVFGASSIAGDRITIGEFMKGQAQTLLLRPLLPMRTLLRLHADDPQLKAPDYAQSYSAQCWFFVHLILIEGEFHDSAAKYLDLMSQGQNEEAAFTASFNVPYEELDKAVHAALANGKIKELILTLAPIESAATPQLVSAAEVNARLAEFGVLHRHDLQGAMQRAQDAINAEPNNERAWRVLALGQVQQGQYAEALRSVERLSTQTSLSAAGYADSAHALTAIGEAVQQHQAVAGPDAPALLQRARDDYERAIALNGDDSFSYYYLARLILWQKDEAAARALKPRMEQEVYRHPRDANLAHGLAQLCAATSDFDDAFKFTVAWQKYAMSEPDRASATAYLSHLKEEIARRAVGASVPSQ
jgi:hypothetical protein